MPNELNFWVKQKTGNLGDGLSETIIFYSIPYSIENRGTQKVDKTMEKQWKKGGKTHAKGW